MAHRIVGPRIHVARELCPHVLPRQQIAIAARVDDIRIIGARGDPTRFAATRLLPIAYVDSTATHATRAA